VIERHITFNVRPDQADAFERFYRDAYAPAMAQSRGYVATALLREAGSPNRYQMAFRFEDEESAAGWRTSPIHEGLQPALNALFDGREVQAYDVIA